MMPVSRSNSIVWRKTTSYTEWTRVIPKIDDHII